MNNLVLGDFDFIPSHLPAEGALNIMINPIEFDDQLEAVRGTGKFCGFLLFG